MGNATSLLNMMRNIGVEVGISLVGTILTRLGQELTNLLVGKITPYSPLAQRLIGGLKNSSWLIPC
jgi:DHA2 family multidrug resistance protein